MVSAETFVPASRFRIEALGNHDGTNGLRLRDLPEMEIDDGKLEFSTTPGGLATSGAGALT